MDLSQLSPVEGSLPPDGQGAEQREPYVRGSYETSKNSRYVALALSLGISFVLLLAIISMTAMSFQKGEVASQLTAIKLTPPPVEQKPHAGAKSKPKQNNVPIKTEAAIKLPPHVKIENPNKVEWPPGFIHMNHADLANSDISNIHSTGGGGKGHDDGSGGGKGGDNGPGESSFYNVEWYRKPPKRALDSYMRPGQDPGRMATIECRMIENYHVDDCHEVSETPRGTGMARVLREASWQFEVRPPRLNGKVLLGTRVHITYTFEQFEKATEGANPLERPAGD